MGEVGLGQRHEHPDVVGGPEYLRETDVRAGLAAVIMGVDEVNAETLEPPQRLPRSVIGRGPGAELGAVQRDGGEVDAGAVQVEVPAVDPKLPKPKQDGIRGVQEIPVSLN